MYEPSRLQLVFGNIESTTIHSSAAGEALWPLGVFFRRGVHAIAASKASSQASLVAVPVGELQVGGASVGSKTMTLCKNVTDKNFLRDKIANFWK